MHNIAPIQTPRPMTNQITLPSHHIIPHAIVLYMGPYPPPHMYYLMQLHSSVQVLMHTRLARLGDHTYLGTYAGPPPPPHTHPSRGGIPLIGYPSLLCLCLSQCMSRPAGVPEEAPSPPPPPPARPSASAAFCSRLSSRSLSWDVPGLTLNRRALLVLLSGPIRFGPRKKIEAYITALRTVARELAVLGLVPQAHANWHFQLDRSTRCAHRSVAGREVQAHILAAVGFVNGCHQGNPPAPVNPVM